MVMATKKSPHPPAPNISLGEAVTQFLISLPSDDRQLSQQELNRFVRWYGEDRLASELKIPEISDYCEQLLPSTSESSDKAHPVKVFLTYVYKKGMVKANLAAHFKIKKAATRVTSSSKHRAAKTISLTAEGYASIESELNKLKDERPIIAAELRKAAADKDFRENAPLEAMREYQGNVEARIKELESTIKMAQVIEEKKVESHKISIGDTVLLRDLMTGEQLNYKLVDAREANPSSGKISTVSPIGQALLGHVKGDEIHVIAPAGNMPYKIEEIE
jgi:transcription elongation factor GreA